MGAGWSVHTNKQTAFKKPVNLTPEEQEQIVRVIRKADMLEQIEQERIGYVLVVNAIKLCLDDIFVTGMNERAFNETRKVHK